jgi:PAS domain S-box-containing protein
MESLGAIDPRYGPGSHCESVRRPTGFFSSWSVGRLSDPHETTTQVVVQITLVFLAYLIAGKLGQATTNIRSSNLGPVWPAYGIALAAFLAYGHRVWPGIALSAFVVAFSSAVPPLAAAGQAIAATIASLTGAFLLRRIPGFHPSLPRLHDAIGLIVLGAFGSAILSASIGVFSLYVTHVQAYSGLGSAWLIYWLGDSTGVLLVTPLVFTVSSLIGIRSRSRILELMSLLALLTATCVVIFGDLPLIPVGLHVFAFAVLPFVMWAAIDFGIGGAALSVLLIATFATLATALGSGPFAGSTSFVNAVRLDVLFAVLAVSGLALAAVITERERAESQREDLIREQATLEARLRLAAIVESSNDAIFSTDLDGIILSWNAAAERIFGYTAAEVVGRPSAQLFPPQLQSEEHRLLERLKAGESIERYETTRMNKSGEWVDVSLTISPIVDTAGALIGTAEIARDMTERNRAAIALAGVSGRLIHAQEQERARIARELHDDIGQRLSMLAVQLTALPVDTQDPLTTIKLRESAAQIAADVQALSHELHSSKLQLLGLAEGMKAHCAEFADQQEVEVVFECRDVPTQLSPEVSLCLFRVLQEALHNALKHSGVRQFNVQLWGSPDAIHLAVTDRGSGFDSGVAKLGRGLGLVSMEERLKLVDGDLAVVTSPGAGTTVYARVSVPSTDRRDPHNESRS